MGLITNMEDNKAQLINQVITLLKQLFLPN